MAKDDLEVEHAVLAVEVKHLATAVSKLDSTLMTHIAEHRDWRASTDMRLAALTPAMAGGESSTVAMVRMMLDWSWKLAVLFAGIAYGVMQIAPPVVK